jgi:hypothetical protein
MAKGKDNLIQIPQRTKEEQREITKKGGKKSAQKRAERKAFADALKLALSLKPSERNKAKLQELGITDPDFLNNQQLGVMKILEKYLKGDIQAFVAIRDTIGEKPTDKTENQNVNTFRIEFVDAGIDPIEEEKQ